MAEVTRPVVVTAKPRCSYCGGVDGLLMEECCVCDGMWQEREDGMSWCFNCSGAGFEWICGACLHPEDDDEPF